MAAVLLRGNGLSLGSVPRQVNHAELLHEPEFVLSSPVLDDLAVGNPVNGNGGSAYNPQGNGRPAPAARQGTAMVHAYAVSTTAQALAHPPKNLFVIGVPDRI